MTTPDLSELSGIPIFEVSELKGETPNKYHDLECCDWTRGIDTLLSHYTEDRDTITSLMLEEPEELIATIWKSDGPLAIDNECRCQMGKGETRSPFACAQCKNLRRLIDFRLGGTERGFQIECGESAGSNLIVASSEINTPFLAWDIDAANRARFYVRQYHNLTICGTPNVSELHCITGDSFTMRTLIVWMIHRIFEEKGLPHCPLVHTAFVCRGIGYSLYNLPSIGSLPDLHKNADYHDIPRNVDMKSQHFAYAPLKSSIARTIIIQLLVILLELINVNFSHGTPSMHGLIFTKDPVSYAYDNVHVEGPITVQISDLWNASATFNGVHYFPKNVKSSMYLQKNMFVPEISTMKVSMAHCHDIGAVESFNKDDSCTEPIQQPIVCPATMTTCPDDVTYSVCKPQSTTLYKLTTSTLDIYNAMRHIGFPLYVGSFDFYCFMVSLMCDKSFYDAVKHDDRLYRLWSMMWLIEDLPIIERKIEQSHAIDSQSITDTGNLPNRRVASNVAIEIIRGAWLRCDVVKFIWSLIKQGW